MKTDSFSTYGRTAAFLLSFFCMVLLMLYPSQAMEAAAEGLALCRDTIFPSLFPFFAVSSLLTALLPTAALEHFLSPLSFPLFRLSGTSAAALLLGFTGGYPVGVRTAAGLYTHSRISREETLRLLAFCNNSGPGFLLGVIGIGVFQSQRVGLMLYAIHIFSALSVGLLFRFYHSDAPAAAVLRTSDRAPSLPSLFVHSVTGALFSVLQVSAFVLCFMVLLRLLNLIGLLPVLSKLLSALLSSFGMTPPLATAFLAGFLELSTGSACLQGIVLTPFSAALTSFLLGWGGLSVHCQSLIFLLDAKLPCHTYFLGKLLQGLFSAVLSVPVFLWYL